MNQAQIAEIRRIQTSLERTIKGLRKRRLKAERRGVGGEKAKCLI